MHLHTAQCNIGPSVNVMQMRSLPIATDATRSKKITRIILGRCVKIVFHNKLHWGASALFGEGGGGFEEGEGI